MRPTLRASRCTSPARGTSSTRGTCSTAATKNGHALPFREGMSIFWCRPGWPRVLIFWPLQVLSSPHRWLQRTCSFFETRVGHALQGRWTCSFFVPRSGHMGIMSFGRRAQWACPARGSNGPANTLGQEMLLHFKADGHAHSSRLATDICRLCPSAGPGDGHARCRAPAMGMSILRTKAQQPATRNPQPATSSTQQRGVSCRPVDGDGRQVIPRCFFLSGCGFLGTRFRKLRRSCRPAG